MLPMIISLYATLTSHPLLSETSEPAIPDIPAFNLAHNLFLVYTTHFFHDHSAKVI